MEWSQTYNPLGNAWLSTLAAAVPVVLLLALIALFKVRVHLAALTGFLAALGIALFVYGMPGQSALAASLFGAAYGFFPIGWIILNLIFLYTLTVEKGLFAVLRSSLGSLAPDPRVQLILVAFAFGAFFEGAAGFGTPVAVTAAILTQLGFTPLAASGLSLIANTAPVAFGSLGTPIMALSAVTGFDPVTLGAMVGRQLPFFSILVPFWVVAAFTGFRGMLGVWPAALVAGVAFAVPQYLVSNFHGPALVDVVASVSSICALILLLKFWKPRTLWTRGIQPQTTKAQAPSRAQLAQAWTPWVLLSITLFLWGLPDVKSYLNQLASWKFNIPGLHNLIFRMPPVTPVKTAESATFVFNYLSATGTSILVAAILSGFLMRFTIGQMVKVYFQTIYKLRFSLLTISAMLALGYVTKYSGTDATIGLALAKTGILYPFFGTLLGWLGVALTGSDTASNVLFGSLQKITAEQAGINPILMCAANSSGGVMGKMVDAQSIVVASTATNDYGREGEILRYVFVHSIVLAAMVGLLVFLQAYVYPFNHMTHHLPSRQLHSEVVPKPQ